MSDHQPARPPTRRPPLGEATRRVNNAQQHIKPSSKASTIPHHESLRQDGLLQIRNPDPGSPFPQEDYFPLHESRAGSPGSNAANPRLSAISRDYPTESNRNSQISTVSTNASDGKRVKSYIGPWRLGKTLGKGATARVRLARHAYTGQEAAIKIVQKKNAQMSQAGSLAALDQAEANLPDSGDGSKRMPVGIEREVAIMKLIQHPNIMKLYDIWENRTEIYLVLEYVDNGELFEHIIANGRLEEEEAVKYFRQILSAVGYCHSFNICHRDLKPENILLTKEGEIRIADFGMAALHQSPDHKLKTACGSPHYAAPELIKGSKYRGDKVDTWSMGVILYATLAGRLPFDVESSGKDWLGPLLLKIREGAYEMAPEFSEDAASLIWRMLQVNPRDRINLNQIWRHPLVRKYDYLDDYGGGCSPQSPSVRNCGLPVLRRSDINKELLRHLRSMWHRLTEQELMDKLLNEEPNDQKLFYSLLLKYREAQSENYTPDVGYSTSDYHHVRPLALTKTYSTCHFPQPKAKGHGRQASRFTVISNVAETEQSYDPFKASRPQYLDSMRPTDRAKITVHRPRHSTASSGNAQPADSATYLESGGKQRQPSRASSKDGRRQSKLAPPPALTSRSSLASSTRSRSSNPYVKASVSYKRGVSFPHIRRRSISGQGEISADTPAIVAVERNMKQQDVTDDDGDILHLTAQRGASTRYIRSRKSQNAPNQPAQKSSRASQLWHEDVRQLSSSLAKDCDEAFNRSSVISTVDSPKTTQRYEKPLQAVEQKTILRESSQLADNTQQSERKSIARNASFDTRPLPPPPARSDSVKIELLEARKQAELRKTSGGDESPRYLDRMVSHIDRLIQPSSPIQFQTDRRASSAPAKANYAAPPRPLPSIQESPQKPEDYEKHIERLRQGKTKTSRIASAPEPRAPTRTQQLYNDQKSGKAGLYLRDTIRVVMPSSPISPVKAPAPLTIRKKSSQGGAPLMSGGLGEDKERYPQKPREKERDLRQQFYAESRADVTPDFERIRESIDDQSTVNDSQETIVKRKPSWFKRNSKLGEDGFSMSAMGNDTLPSQSSSTDSPRTNMHLHVPPPIPQKKKGFNFSKLFRKRSSKIDMTVVGDIFDNHGSPTNSFADGIPDFYAEETRNRQIEPHQNWLAKLFNVKPASKFICFSVSKRRARQEIANILRGWKRYGIRDVQVDKERNIVFSRVGAKNYLDLKEVAFAGEIMTVIEHGKRSHLSIARFTQERGAASSFHKVLETLETVLKARGLLVTDERKKRMMVKTLNAT